MALDLTNNELFVGNFNAASVTVYSGTASGDTAPLQTLTGPSTFLDNPVGIGLRPALATPALTSTSNPASSLLGTTLNDSATLSGGVSPTGTIAFALFPPSDAACAGTPSFTQNVTVSGNGTYSTAGGFVANTAGTWHWTAGYSGDSNNNPASSACSAEPVTVSSSATPIPTLTQWGMLLFVLLLVGIAFRTLRRQRGFGAA